VAGDLAEVSVDVGRVDRVPPARLVEVLEEGLARQIAAIRDDPGEPLVGEVDRVLDAALALKSERQAQTSDMSDSDDA
jgi:hypothetical protein